ncbi:MAG: hypothetical protein RAP70_01775 [Candidatus Celaenobacter antarcticus]|nr:hypothetical protein [Candidatus Celaenobacter antarcticus]
MRAFNLITTFSITYSDEGLYNLETLSQKQKVELWDLWARLFPVIIRNAPLGIFLNSARFCASMDEAIKYLDVYKGIKVLNSWFERIDYQIKNGRMLDESEMSIADYLMDLTIRDNIVRKDLFKKLIDYNDTNFLLSSLKWIVGYHWDKLDDSEIKQILYIITSDRKDVRWIKAVLVTRPFPNNEICLSILGEEEIFKKNFEYILSKFPNQLLRDSLNVFCGFPQPLYRLAVHHENTVFWIEVIKYILLGDKHVGFDICLEIFIDNGVNGFREYWGDWEVLWEEICSKAKDKKFLADILIFYTARCSCVIDTTKKLWSILIENYKSNEEEIIEIIVNKIEMLQSTGNEEDLFKFFDNQFIFNKIIPKLEIDYTIIKLLNVFFKSGIALKEEDKCQVVSMIQEIIKEKNIRFFYTRDLIKDRVCKKYMTDELNNELKKQLNFIKKRGKETLEKEENKYEYKLDDWIGIN